MKGFHCGKGKKKYHGPRWETLSEGKGIKETGVHFPVVLYMGETSSSTKEDGYLP